ncbi:MAG TPA: hypothetical protein PK370_00205 [Candidatus Woesebacteria bacterium]|nr:hypothetical protein [Candidatus Woesebacteria bacterium]
MKTTIKALCLLLIFSFFLSSCGKKTAPAPSPTPAPRAFTLENQEIPYVKLTPSLDGHWLYLEFKNLSKNFSKIDYELIYSAIDNGNEIEKGLAGTIEQSELNSSVKKDLLLGTQSCTNGCKYKYDSGVVGGVITLTIANKSSQVATVEYPFVLQTGSKIKQSGISYNLDNLIIKANTSGNDSYLLIKNPQSYSIFSSSNQNSKWTDISPKSVTKSTESFLGDYQFE